MLVLGRKLGEEIWIGPDVRITVIRIDGQTVRLGVDAPRNVRVDRAEIASIRRPRQKAAAKAHVRKAA